MNFERMKSIISHLYQDEKDGRWIIQSNEEHTEGVAERASRFASEFGMASWGKVLGMLHDKGKESNAFQAQRGMSVDGNIPPSQNILTKRYMFV